MTLRKFLIGIRNTLQGRMTVAVVLFRLKN
jgi:hypothetical protein